MSALCQISLFEFIRVELDVKFMKHVKGAGTSYKILGTSVICCHKHSNGKLVYCHRRNSKCIWTCYRFTPVHSLYDALTSSSSKTPHFGNLV
jgi:hypothetical protein